MVHISSHMSVKVHKNYFRAIMKPDRNNTVTHSSADNHGGVCFRELTCIVNANIYLSHFPGK